MNHCPGCKQTFTNTRQLSQHKRECEALEQRVYAEIKRLSGELGMAVSTRQYNRLADQSLPRSVWLIHAYGDWNEILQLAGQRPRKAIRIVGGWQMKRVGRCVCGHEIKARGLCMTCYQRQRRANQCA